MIDEKKFYMDFIRQRMNFGERETRQLAEHILAVKEQLLAGESAEKTLQEVEKFLNSFSTDFHSVEAETEKRTKKKSRTEKKKRQLDIFEAKK